MSIKLATTTAAFAGQSLEPALSNIATLGYDGVEIAAPTLGGPGDAQPIQSDTLAQAGLTPVCLSTSLVLIGGQRQAGESEAEATRRVVHQLRYRMDDAATIGCPLVRAFAGNLPAGRSMRWLVSAIAEHLDMLGEHAADAGVQLVFENAGSMSAAQPWWDVFNIAAHPMLGLCWNPAAAAAVGESPAVSLPMLNHRIRLVRAMDFERDRQGVIEPRQLGDGEGQFEHWVNRLCGLGYDGFLSVHWDGRYEAAFADASAYLEAARGRIRELLDDIEASQADPKQWAKDKAAALKAADAAAKPKPAAKPAPKPAKADKDGDAKTDDPAKKKPAPSKPAAAADAAPSTDS